MRKIRNAVIKAAEGLFKMLPLLIGIILLISLAKAIIPETAYASLFRNNALLNPLIGSAVGSILAGSPITSYILGGELLEQGVSLLAVTAFLVAWVTVGIVQIPAESIMLGKRFAIIRNIVGFVFAIIVAVVTVTITGLIT